MWHHGAVLFGSCKDRNFKRAFAPVKRLYEEGVELRPDVRMIDHLQPPEEVPQQSLQQPTVRSRASSNLQQQLLCSALVRGITESERAGITAATPSSPIYLSRQRSIVVPGAMAPKQLPAPTDERSCDWGEVAAFLASLRLIMHWGAFSPAWACLDDNEVGRIEAECGA